MSHQPSAAHVLISVPTPVHLHVPSPVTLMPPTPIAAPHPPTRCCPTSPHPLLPHIPPPIVAPHPPTRCCPTSPHPLLPHIPHPLLPHIPPPVVTPHPPKKNARRRAKLNWNKPYYCAICEESLFDQSNQEPGQDSIYCEGLGSPQTVYQYQHFTSPIPYVSNFSVYTVNWTVKPMS